MIVVLCPLFLAEQWFGGVFILRSRQKHLNRNVQSFMLLLNPEINQMRQIRTNFVFKCLVLTSTSVCEGSFPWLFKVVTWLCQLMPVHDEAEPLFSEPFRGGSSAPTCAWLIRGNGPCTTGTVCGVKAVAQGPRAALCPRQRWSGSQIRATQQHKS